MNCKYVSSDGTTVPSLLYVPGEQAPPEGWSAVVVLHGGPGDHFRRGFDPYAQFFAKMNFVVLEANIRGSSGFGRKHQEAIRAHGAK
jgi:dipeptidyl aminopeptidase/acylaminoacyl peptidase